MMANPYQGGDVDPFSGARDEEGNIKRERSRDEEMNIKREGSFKDAFAAARSAGDKNFMFKGKKYTTDVKGTPSAKAAEVFPASMGGKERASEMARIQARGGKDRMGESAAGRVMQSLMNRSGEDEAVPSRETPSFSSLKGMTMREKMAAMRGGMKKGGMVKKYKQGGTVSSASKRADGIAIKGKTKGRFV
jgi:hypothetical protein